MDIVVLMLTKDGKASSPLAHSHASHSEESPLQGHHVHHPAGYNDCKDAFDADFNNFHGNHYYRDRQFLTPTLSNLWRKAADRQPRPRNIALSVCTFNFRCLVIWYLSFFKIIRAFDHSLCFKMNILQKSIFDLASFLVCWLSAVSSFPWRFIYPSSSISLYIPMTDSWCNSNIFSENLKISQRNSLRLAFPYETSHVWRQERQ